MKNYDSTSESCFSLPPQEVEKICRGEHENLFAVLGMHLLEENGVVVRAFLPYAQKVWVVLGEEKKNWPLRRIHAEGLFEAFLPLSAPVNYLLRIETDWGECLTADAYSFEPLLSDLDIYLFKEGTHYQAFNFMGAHFEERRGVEGVCFRVWAPNALRVSVVGDFNRWDGRVHQMQNVKLSGIWEIFIPGVQESEKYKFEVRAKEGHLLLKADPFAFASELRPRTASVLYRKEGKFSFSDQDWVERRKSRNLLEEPVSIYEVHLGSWKRNQDGGFLNYRELAHLLVNYVEKMGYTHIELLPVAEHPFDGSWGYHVTGYFAPTSRYGKPEDFKYFVDYCHRHRIGVILDWVVAHFPKDAHGLARFDGTPLFEYPDPRKAEHPHWGSLVFDYAREEVRSFLISNAVFWLQEYHIDALRVDAVASMLYLDYGRGPGEWVPNVFGGKENLEAVDFLRTCNRVVYQWFPGVFTAAEESTAWPGVTLPPEAGGLGFLFKWNMGWMNDFLTYMSKDPVYRKYHHQNLTFPIVYAFSENFILPLSHDEVVHGKGSLINKMPGDTWQKFANLRLAMVAMFGYPGKKLLFMGNDFAQWREWNHDGELDWFLLKDKNHRAFQRLVRDLQMLYRRERALWENDTSPQSFRWIDCSDVEQSVISFLRFGKNDEECLVFVCNFTPVPRFRYRIGVPFPGFYREVLNSDSEIYGGSNLGNWGGIEASGEPRHGFPYSIELALPPLGGLILKPDLQRGR